MRKAFSMKNLSLLQSVARFIPEVPYRILERLHKYELVPLELKGLRLGPGAKMGLIVGSDFSNVASFLLENYKAKGESVVANLVREVWRLVGPKYIRVDRLAYNLRQLQGEEQKDSFLIDETESESGYVWTEKCFSRKFKFFPWTVPPVYLPSYSRSVWCAVIHRKRLISGHQIPMLDCLAALTADDKNDEEIPRFLVGWVRDKFVRVPVDKLDEHIWHEFDEHGELVCGAEDITTVSEGTVPKFLVRIPKRRPKTYSSAELPDVARNIPGAFLVDSRIPQDLSKDLPVIEEPSLAWAILQRTSSGIFMSDHPCVEPPKSLSCRAGQYLVARVPQFTR